MYLVYSMIGWIIGLFVVSYTIIQILIILFFGFPITRKLEKTDLLNKNNAITKRYIYSLLLLSLIFIAISYGIYVFIPQILGGYIFGGIMIMVLGIGKIGKNMNNISDYLNSNRKYLKTDDEVIIEAICSNK